MQLRPIAAIVVVSLVVASLSVAGCTTSTTSTNNQTPSASTTSSTATHDAFLEQYLAALKNARYSNNSTSVKACEVTWINSTSARVGWTMLNKATNNTWSYVDTISVLPTSDAATQYLNATNKTAYSLVTTQYHSGGGAYQDLTGHAPQIYKDYVWNEGDPSNISAYTYHEIEQLDNIVFVITGKILS